MEAECQGFVILGASVFKNQLFFQKLFWLAYHLYSSLGMETENAPDQLPSQRKSELDLEIFLKEGSVKLRTRTTKQREKTREGSSDEFPLRFYPFILFIKQFLNVTISLQLCYLFFFFFWDCWWWVMNEKTVRNFFKLKWLPLMFTFDSYKIGWGSQ